jgi:hypothetical protein
MRDIKRCFDCGRIGSRGFHMMMWGAHFGKFRCNSARACDERKYRKFMGLK